MEKKISETRVVKTSRVFPSDTNNSNTLFGGKLMSYIDDIASISATRLSRTNNVTASTDSVDFLCPIRPTDSVCLESFVTYTGNTSMEVFVKVIAEDLLTGERRIAATSFLTFVSLDEENKPTLVPKVIPETDEEIYLFKTAPDRAILRKQRLLTSKELAKIISISKPW